MRIQEIDAFLAVCKYGSFSRAAEKVFTTQSTISQQISSLEKEFNVQLFVRGKGQHQIILTDAGQAFFQQAEKWAQLYTETKSAMSSQHVETYTFGCVASFTDEIFPVIYRRFQQHIPHSSLHVFGNESGRIFDYLESGQCDSGLVCNIRPAKNISAIPMACEEFTFVCRRDSDYPDLISLRSLDTSNYVQLNWSNEFAAWQKHWFGAQAKPPIQAAIVRRADTLFLSRNNWSVIPMSFVKTFDATIYRFCKMDSPPPNRMFYLVSKYPYREPFYSTIYQALITALQSLSGMQLLAQR